LANAGGIGGGALLTPIYIWLYDFSFEDAIPLSKMTIFTGAIVNYIILKNVRMENNKNQPLINYNLSGLVVPMLLGGTTVGVMFAKTVPPIIILSLLLMFLMISIVSMTKKGVSAWKKETENLKLLKNISEESLNKDRFLDEIEEEKSSLIPKKTFQEVNANSIDISSNNHPSMNTSGSKSKFSNPAWNQNGSKASCDNIRNSVESKSIPISKFFNRCKHLSYSLLLLPLCHSQMTVSQLFD
jgi:ABC-type multidrug transport system fused ATPase/permease subunit